MVEISQPDANSSFATGAERCETLNALNDVPVQKPDAKAPWSVRQVLDDIPKFSTFDFPKTSVVPFLHLIERLKTTKREGWRRFGISSGESIADHMYRMSIMTMLCPTNLASRLNIPHCTKMALVHDMAESLVGDITPVDGVSKSEKARREQETMQYLGNNLLGGCGSGEPGDSLKMIWEEYEASETLEAIFVHDVDKMELVLQMVEYERRGEGKLDLGEFAWVAKRIQLDEMKRWCEEVLEERNAMWRHFQPQETNT